ncbi:MAG TPA: cytochrome c oxidase assembly protein [Acidimicrobiales bacterium]|nr:cytochrome c oxidase assembly protein [Acidimicrobiales bacterium]
MSGSNGMSNVRFDLHNALTAWQWSPFSIFIVAVVIALGCWYLSADWQLAARGRRWPGLRTMSFFGGLVAIDLAFQSPVSTFTGSYFEAHVVQHLLLMIVAPPLLAMGAPSTLLLQTASRKIKTRWLAVLRSRPFAVLTHPVTAWSLYFGLMFVFFLTPLINFAMQHMALMDAINIVFLIGGCVFWWPLVGADPIVHWKMSHGARMFSVLVGAAPETFLGVAILSLRDPIASMYSVQSTHAGGGLLWMSTEFATVIAFVPIFVQWMRSEERIAAREDARREAGHRPSSSSREAEAAQRWEAEWMARTGSVPSQAVEDG